MDGQREEVGVPSVGPSISLSQAAEWQPRGRKDSALWHSWGSIDASERELSRVVVPLKVTTGCGLYLILSP